MINLGIGLENGKNSGKQPTIYIATVHVGEKWVDIQYKYIKRFLGPNVKFYVEYVGTEQASFPSEWNIWKQTKISSVEKLLFNFWSRILSGKLRSDAFEHGRSLDRLASRIQKDSTHDEDLLIFIDSDAFPIADLSSLLEDLKHYDAAAVQRLDNAGDAFPHPSFFITKYRTWQSYGFKWTNTPFSGVMRAGQLSYKRYFVDTGSRVAHDFQKHEINWKKLVRSNGTNNIHPVFFGIYGGIVYHHGAGSRPDPQTRAAHFKKEDLSKIIGYSKNIYELLKIDENFLSNLPNLFPPTSWSKSKLEDKRLRLIKLYYVIVSSLLNFFIKVRLCSPGVLSKFIRLDKRDYSKARQLASSRYTEEGLNFKQITDHLTKNHQASVHTLEGVNLFDELVPKFLEWEAGSAEESCLLIEGLFPVDFISASGTRTTDFWSGDRWKLIPFLIEKRSEYSVEGIPCKPFGALLVKRTKSTFNSLETKKEMMSFFSFKYGDLSLFLSNLPKLQPERSALTNFLSRRK